MKNFDAERLAPVEKDRSFTIGGHSFEYRVGVRPEVLARYYDGGDTNAETLAIYDETVLTFLDPDVAGQAEGWEAVRAVEGEGALTLADIKRLIEWLIQEQSARPTGRPTDSSGGSGSQSNGTASTAVSGSQVPEASTV